MCEAVTEGSIESLGEYTPIAGWKQLSENLLRMLSFVIRGGEHFAATANEQRDRVVGFRLTVHQSFNIVPDIAQRLSEVLFDGGKRKRGIHIPLRITRWLLGCADNRLTKLYLF